jgi:glycosyltransferase involved in cell wall biosynthesis
MRIMIDGYNLALPRGTGVATYGVQLAHAIRTMGFGLEGLYGLRVPYNPRLREIMFYESMGRDHVTRPPKFWQPEFYREASLLLRSKMAREIPVNGSVVAKTFGHRLPAFDRLFTAPDIFDQGMRHFRKYGQFLTVRVPNPPDVMHWTYPVPVQLAGARNIYTLHDLVPLRLPYASLDNKRVYHRLINHIVKTADHICTVSETSNADIETLFPAAKGRVTNCYQSVNMTVGLMASQEDVANQLQHNFNLPDKGYFLFFGAIEPKKNVGRLIEAYLSLSTQTPLVLVGARAWGSEDELRLLQKDELNPFKTVFRNIRRIDYVPRSLLYSLIRGAKAVAFPSLYEGFGLPVLEAMSFGTPVLTSNVSSLPEVVGEAALTVNPYDVTDIAKGLRQLDNDAELRTRLSALGLKQTERFSMDNYRRDLLGMYSKVIAK